MRNACKALIIENGKYLLLKRSVGHPHFLGLWDFPGGRQDEDETLEQTVVREAKEETSLDITVNKMEKEADFIHEQYAENLHFYIFSVSKYTGNIKLSKDHTEYLWLTKEEILRLNLHPAVKIYFEK